jgi:hypothetical protein
MKIVVGVAGESGKELMAACIVLKSPLPSASTIIFFCANICAEIIMNNIEIFFFIFNLLVTLI